MSQAKETAMTIFTAGYEGQSVDEFMQKLAAGGVRQVLDVRRNAISRKPGFSKSALAAAAENYGLDYEHIPELGVPKELRQGLKSREDYDRLLAHYLSELLPEMTDYVEEAAALVQLEPTVLVCFEADHTLCHREPLSAVLSDLTGYAVKHL